MKRILLVAVSLVLVVAYKIQNNDKSKLTTNTEAYFLAHGIVQGQVNHLRIGGTLFRFPAGVGLNPYTSQTKIRSIDGSPMTLSSKEGLDQGKYEEVATPIVKGKADSVTFHLEPEQGYAPSPSPFSGGIRVTISQHDFHKWDGVNANPDEYLKSFRGRRVIERSTLGLREYVAPKEQYGTYFESLEADANSASKNGLFFSCQPGMTGLCFRSYWVEDGKYSVEIVMGAQFFLHHWQEACPAVARFVETVVAR
jgi:hypothetical protein